MSFEVLHKSPEVAPLLVRLYDTHNLYSLAQSKDSDPARSELTNIMVDLLKIKLSDKESELITDVLFALMKKAEQDLRVALSEHLATMDNIPLRMILGLANDEITVADHVLKLSPVLTDLDLMYIIQSKGEEHWRSIAMRKGLSASVIDVLAGTKDFQTAINLSNNDGVMLTEKAYEILSDMAKTSQVLAKPLLMRDDLPHGVADKLYDYVGAELKSLLKERFKGQVDVVEDVIDQIVFEMSGDHDKVELDEEFALMNLAKRMHMTGELKTSTMIAALRRNQMVTFATQFSVYCSLPVDTVKAAVKHKTGQNLALLCRAFDIQKSDFISIYLLTAKLRTPGQKVVSHVELSRIMTMFDEIHPDEAKRIVRGTRYYH
jgi:hypothetical protein